jgi:hypothetical protein
VSGTIFEAGDEEAFPHLRKFKPLEAERCRSLFLQNDKWR